MTENDEIINKKKCTQQIAKPRAEASDAWKNPK